jgi:hypothetical protein
MLFLWQFVFFFLLYPDCFGFRRQMIFFLSRVFLVDLLYFFFLEVPLRLQGIRARLRFLVLGFHQTDRERGQLFFA